MATDRELVERLLRVRRRPVLRLLRLVLRYVSGRPMSGRPGYGYLRRGAGRLTGWQRQLLRIAVPAVAGAAAAYPDQAAGVGVALALAAAWPARRWLSGRRFRAEYTRPTLEAIRQPLGLLTGVRLRVDPGLGQLVSRLAKPLSPAEQAARRWYGSRVEPVLRWVPERVQRAVWAAQRAAEPVTGRLAAFRRPTPTDVGPRIELGINSPYLTKEQRALVSSIIGSKIPVGDLVESWSQIGPKVSARWTVRKRPPARVGADRLQAVLPTLAEWEYYLGDGVGGAPVKISLHEDSPHIAVSAGSGAGKSVFAQLVSVQVLHRGGRVTILDRKGSHRWALGLPGVDYCTRPAEMHAALIRLAAMADQRNDDALREPEGWDPGERHFVVAEELNATLAMLAAHWAEIRPKGGPKRSPAISALGEILFMGRSAKINLLGVAQMLSARSIGGPEARENFGIRCLARFTANAWKMLVPEAAMPRPSRTLGRWQVVIGGVAQEVQVCYLTASEARAVAVPDGPLSCNVPGDGDIAAVLTLREAIDAGVLPWSYEAAKKRLQRDVGEPPKPRGRKGSADSYARTELVEWAARSAA